MANQHQYLLPSADVTDVGAGMGSAAHTTASAAITVSGATIPAQANNGNVAGSLPVASTAGFVVAGPTNPGYLIVPVTGPTGFSGTEVIIGYTGGDATHFFGCSVSEVACTIASGARVDQLGDTTTYSTDNTRRNFAAALSRTGTAGDYVYFPHAASFSNQAFIVNFATGYTDATNRQIRSVALWLLGEEINTPTDGFLTLTATIGSNDGSFSVGQWVAPFPDPIHPQDQITNAFAITSAAFPTKTPTAGGSSAFTAADIAKLQVFVANSATSPGPNTAETRLNGAVIDVAYNDPPSVTPAISNATAGVVHALPIFTWTYSDPENDPQASYRLVVFTQAAAKATPPFDINTPSTWTGLLYDSGDITSTATTFTPPTSFLSAVGTNTLLRGFLLVSDQGSNGRYCVLANSSGAQPGALNTGIDFSLAISPVLMPALELPSSPGLPASSFSPSSGAVAPIVARARPNLLPYTDSTFLTAARAASKGTWFGQSNLPGANITSDLNGYAGHGRIIFKPNAATAVAKCAPVGVSAGDLLTASIKIATSDATNTFNIQLGIAFYSDTTGTTLIESVRYCPAATIPTTTTTSLWTTLYTQSRAPLTAQSAVLFLNFTSVINGTFYYGTLASLTPNQLNLTEDASFETGGLGFWRTSDGASETYIQSDSDTATYAYSAWSLDANRASNANAIVQGGTLRGDMGTTGASWVLAADIRSITGTSATLGTATTGATPAFVTSSTVTTSSTWGRYTTTILGSGVGGSLVAQSIQADTGHDIHVDNVQLEMVWPFPYDASGTPNVSTFESVTATTHLPMALPLGWPRSALSGAANNLFDGHYWMRADNDAANQASIDATQFHSGAQSLKLFCGGTATHDVMADALFTVSGYSSFTLDFFMRQSAVPIPSTGPPVVCWLEFLDSGGVKLSNPPGAGGSFTAGVVNSRLNIATAPLTPNTWTAPSSHVTVTVTPPANAAYCHLTFTIPLVTGTGQSLWIDDVTFTPTGTVAPSSPWLDGGWSQGGILQATTAPTMYVERIDGVGSSWTKLRVPPGSMAPYPIALPQWELDYADYEYPAGQFGTQQVLMYRAAMLSFDPNNIALVSPLSQLFTLVNANSFAVSGSNQGYWLLMDPLYPADNVSVRVKTAKFTTDENQTVFMPVGRGRKVVIGDTPIFGDTITLETNTVSAADFIALQKQYSKTYPIMLRSPDGEFWYVRLTKRSRERVWTGSYVNPFRTYSLTFETVDIVP